MRNLRSLQAGILFLVVVLWAGATPAPTEAAAFPCWQTIREFFRLIRMKNPEDKNQRVSLSTLSDKEFSRIVPSFLQKKKEVNIRRLSKRDVRRLIDFLQDPEVRTYNSQIHFRLDRLAGGDFSNLYSSGLNVLNLWLQNQNEISKDLAFQIANETLERFPDGNDRPLTADEEAIRANIENFVFEYAARSTDLNSIAQPIRAWLRPGLNGFVERKPFFADPYNLNDATSFNRFLSYLAWAPRVGIHFSPLLQEMIAQTYFPPDESDLLSWQGRYELDIPILYKTSLETHQKRISRLLKIFQENGDADLVEWAEGKSNQYVKSIRTFSIRMARRYLPAQEEPGFSEHEPAHDERGVGQ